MILTRTTEKEDIDWVLEAESNAQNYNYVFQWPYEKHLKSLINTDIKHQIILDKNNNKVGYIIIAGLNNENNSIELRRLVITKKNRGYGKQAIKNTIKLAFEQLKAHRLWLDVKTYNDKAIIIYEYLGFKKEGLLRGSVLLDGKYESLYLYSMLEEEYKDRVNANKGK